jgi:formate--tetrahydrofolate ligase
MEYHGGIDLANLTTEDTEAVNRGLVNLERHFENITKVYNLPCVVLINQFTSDTKAEIALIEKRMGELGVNVVLASHWSEGGKGAADLARLVVDLCESDDQQMHYAYEDDDTLWEKINKIAKKIYRAREVTADKKVQAQIENLQRQGYGHYPVCVAKTQSSFSTDPKSRGAPDDHVISVREVRLAAGAEFVVMICGDIMTMPGLPKNPSASSIDYVDGKVVGLF